MRLLLLGAALLCSLSVSAAFPPAADTAYMPKPAYPAAMGTVSGNVRVSLNIHNDGSVTDVKLLSATHEAFGLAAKAAVEQWRFQPWTVDKDAPAVVDAQNTLIFDPGLGTPSPNHPQIAIHSMLFQTCEMLSDELANYRSRYPGHPLSSAPTFSRTTAALLYPVSVPFGLGQVWDRLEMELANLLAETPFLAWVPFRVENPLPLSPLAEAFCVALGLLAPLLMGFADMRSLSRRVGFLVAFFVCALAVSGLSSALTYGPEHGWAWITSQALLGLALAFVAGLALLVLPRRVCHALMLLCLATSLSLLNRAPVSPYFDQSLEVWEQGRFIRFYGLSQWLGWLWPFSALLFGLRAIARHPGAGQGAH